MMMRMLNVHDVHDDPDDHYHDHKYDDHYHDPDDFLSQVTIDVLRQASKACVVKREFSKVNI